MSIRDIDLKNGLVSFFIIAGVLGAGVFIGKTFFGKTEIKVVDKIVYKTVYKEATPTQYTPENFEQLVSWANSPILFKDRTETNYLFVTAFDDHKEATARYEIGTVGDWKVYAILAGVGAIGGGYVVYKLIK